MNTKRGVALTTPLTAPFKTVTSLILFLKNNRRPAKADGYFFLIVVYNCQDSKNDCCD